MARVKNDIGRAVLWSDTVYSLVEKVMIPIITENIEDKYKCTVKREYKERLEKHYGEVSHDIRLSDKRVEVAAKIIKEEKSYWGNKSPSEIVEELIQDKALLKLEEMYEGIKAGDLELSTEVRKKIVFEANKVKSINKDRKTEVCKRINEMFLKEKRKKLKQVGA